MQTEHQKLQKTRLSRSSIEAILKQKQVETIDVMTLFEYIREADAIQGGSLSDLELDELIDTSIDPKAAEQRLKKKQQHEYI